MTKHRVVVTGLGVVSSIGIGKDVFWKNLTRGKSGISEITSYDTSGHVTHRGGEVKDFNPEEYINKKRLKFMGRTSQFAIAAAKQATKDANLDPKGLNAAVIIGTTMGEIRQLERMDRIWLEEGEARINRELVFQYLTNAVSSNLALELKTTGRNRMFGTACAAGNYAIGYGYDLIRDGKADIVIAGGSDSFSWIAFTGFNQFAAVAPDKCQPFDKNRKGMMVGEGAGILILENKEAAKKRGVHAYAEISGYGLSCDAHHMTNPLADGIVECMENAIKDSEIDRDSVDYISAHGTGTIHNDKAECMAVKKVFGDRYKKVPISSIKSMLGHTMGAASAIEAISCCLALRDSIIPPTINYETPDSDCDIDCVPNKARSQKLNAVLNNAYAFGGNNACLVIKRINGEE